MDIASAISSTSPKIKLTPGTAHRGCNRICRAADFDRCSTCVIHLIHLSPAGVRNQTIPRNYPEHPAGAEPSPAPGKEDQ